MILLYFHPLIWRHNCTAVEEVTNAKCHDVPPVPLNQEWERGGVCPLHSLYGDDLISRYPPSWSREHLYMEESNGNTGGVSSEHFQPFRSAVLCRRAQTRRPTPVLAARRLFLQLLGRNAPMWGWSHPLPALSSHLLTSHTNPFCSPFRT